MLSFKTVLVAPVSTKAVTLTGGLAAFLPFRGAGKG